MEPHTVKKVVIIGPESTGKSTLCKQLASHYNTIWVKEYAREFLQKQGGIYTYDDLLEIAKGQIRLEEQALPLAANDLLFIDTNMYVMKVWCEFVFHDCHTWILEQLEERKYDLYLLCNPDLPWVKDELREYPEIETRLKLYLKYRDLMKSQSLPWVDIKGDYLIRLQTAITVVDRLIQNS